MCRNYYWDPIIIRLVDDCFLHAKLIHFDELLRTLGFLQVRYLSK